MGTRPERSVLYKNISSSEEENEQFRALLSKNVNVFIQVMPQDKPVSVAKYLN
jgi:PTS system mannose-specific IIB component